MNDEERTKRTRIRHRTIRMAILAAVLVVGAGWTLEYFHPAPMVMEMHEEPLRPPYGNVPEPQFVPNPSSGYSF